MKEREVWKNNNQKIQLHQNKLSIDNINIPTAKDILEYFNTYIYPEIKKKYESMLNPTKRWFLKLFGKKVESKSDIYKQRWSDSATKMTEFIIGDDIHNITRIKLLLETIRLEMWWAYWNVYLDYTYAAEKYEKNWETDKAKIIKHCLKILSDRFRDQVATITFEGDHIIIETRKEKKVVHKDEFFKKH
jgi:hypothetical protein